MNNLFIVPLPPPLHGASFYSQLIIEKFCDKKDDVFKTTINSDIFLIKFFEIINQFFKLIFLAFKNYHKIYYVAGNTKKTLLRDLIIFILFYRKDLIIHFHNKNNFNWFINFFIIGNLIKNKTSIILSQSLENDFLYTDSNKRVFIKNGLIDVSDDSLKKISKPIKIGFLSNFILEKGVVEIINFFNFIIERDCDAELYMHGIEYDISVSELKSYLSEKSKNKVKINGNGIFGSEKNNFFKNIDVFIFPTKNDCLPTVLLEAQMFSVPVLTTNEGAVSDIIQDNFNGSTKFSNNNEYNYSLFNEIIKNYRFYSKNSRNNFKNNFNIEKFYLEMRNILS